MNDPIRMTWPMYRRSVCFYHGRRVRLGRVCIDILSTLLLNRGRSVTYSEMIEAVYPDPDFEPDKPPTASTTRSRPFVRDCRGW